MDITKLQEIWSDCPICKGILQTHTDGNTEISTCTRCNYTERTNTTDWPESLKKVLKTGGKKNMEYDLVVALQNLMNKQQQTTELLAEAISKLEEISATLKGATIDETEEQNANPKKRK